MIESARETANGPLEFIFRVDDDDDSFPEDIARRPGVVVVRKPRDVLSQLWNDALDVATADIFMQADDEVIFRTPGWDAHVAGAFAAYTDKIIFVHGQDGHQVPGTFGTLGFLHRRWTDTIGYFTPPYFSSDYGDTWLNEVANMLDRRVYLPEVFTEHMHPIAGKAAWDKTHQERLARGQRDDVAGRYAALLPARLEDAEKLRAVMQ